jgi:hypothetical protein
MSDLKRIGWFGEQMKRFRLSTLLLLVVIVAEGIALVMQHRELARLCAELERKEADLDMAREYVHKMNDIKSGQTRAGARAEQQK